MKTLILVVFGLVIHMASARFVSNNVCTGMPNGAKLPVVGDCSKFIVCQYSEQMIISCISGTLYDPIIQVCNWAHLVQCNQQPTTTPWPWTSPATIPTPAWPSWPTPTRPPSTPTTQYPTWTTPWPNPPTWAPTQAPPTYPTYPTWQTNPTAWPEPTTMTPPTWPWPSFPTGTTTIRPQTTTPAYPSWPTWPSVPNNTMPESTTMTAPTWPWPSFPTDPTTRPPQTTTPAYPSWPTWPSVPNNTVNPSNPTFPTAPTIVWPSPETSTGFPTYPTVPSQSSTTPSPYPECSRDGFYFLPHPTDCESYYICAYGMLILHSCGTGVYWNPATNQCDFPENTECKNFPYPAAPETSTAIITTMTETTEKLPDCNGIEIFHACEDDCSKYYICIGASPILMSCPDDYLWNKKISQCDSPEETVCDV